MSAYEPLLDQYNRLHSNLRISVTDRCNIRCFYCMPDESIVFKPKAEILTFEEIERFVRLLAPVGVNKLRLTGGEPLVRAHLPDLISRLAAIPGINDLALTTNGILLTDQARLLKEAGLQRINISLDTLSAETFQRITRRSGLEHMAAEVNLELTNLSASWLPVPAPIAGINGEIQFIDDGRGDSAVRLALEGRLDPGIDRILPLKSAPEAHAAIAAGSVNGKVVLDPQLD